MSARKTGATIRRYSCRIYALQCPYCQGRRKLIAFITEAPVIRAILECLDLPSDPPVLSLSRWPP